MRKLACLASFSLVVAAVGSIAACASVQDDVGASSADALTTLTVAQCKTPAVHTAPKTDSSGATIAGSAHTTLAGCIVGAQGETGDGVLTRLTTLLADTGKLGTVKDAQGAKVFSQFTPGTRHGSLTSSVTQDFDVVLALDHAPFTRLHTAQSRPAGAPYSLSIVNSTPLAANVAFFTVTVVNPGEFSLTLQGKAAANGITITGASDIVLQQQQDQAASASVLVTDVFRWLTTELAKTAPPPHPVTPASDGGGSDGSASLDGGSSADASASDGGGEASVSDASPE
jgi:hypothetical protein